MTDLPVELEEVRVLRLQPGDVIVVRIERPVTQVAADTLREKLEEAFPGHKGVILDGASMEVIRPEHPDGTGEAS